MRTRRKLPAAGGSLAALGAAGYWFGLRGLLNPMPPDVGFSLTDDELGAAQAFMAAHPIIDSPAHINTPALSHLRFVSEEIAHSVAGTGGYIGAWPAKIGETTLAVFNDRIDFLLDAVGEVYVAMGSDMDANYKPMLESYRKMPLVVGALQKRG